MPTECAILDCLARVQKGHAKAQADGKVVAQMGLIHSHPPRVQARVDEAFACTQRALDYAQQQTTPRTDSNEEPCSICLEDFVSCALEGGARQILIASPCGHGFHAGCIARWMNTATQCPLCRSHIGILVGLPSTVRT